MDFWAKKSLKNHNFCEQDVNFWIERSREEENIKRRILGLKRCVLRPKFAQKPPFCAPESLDPLWLKIAIFSNALFHRFSTKIGVFFPSLPPNHHNLNTTFIISILKLQFLPQKRRFWGRKKPILSEKTHFWGKKRWFWDSPKTDRDGNRTKNCDFHLKFPTVPKKSQFWWFSPQNPPPSDWKSPIFAF